MMLVTMMTIIIIFRCPKFSDASQFFKYILEGKE